MADLTEKLLVFIREHRLLLPGDSLLVALSGGADSMALIHALLELRTRLGLKRLAAAHVNHCLRGAEADRDEEAVCHFCAEQELPCFVERIDVAGEAMRQRKGVEETAREMRYACLRALAEREGFGKIATAHTASDNTETILLHLTRGSGMNGLCGIHPHIDGVIRPMLNCTREEVERYCADNALPYVTDSTNGDTTYARNRLRACVVPELRQINPRVDEAFGRLIGQALAISSFLNDTASQVLADARITVGRYCCERLRQLPPVVCAEALRLAFIEAGGTSLDERHTDWLCRLVAAGGAADLPDGMRAEVLSGVLAIGKNRSPSTRNEKSQTVFPDKTYEFCGRNYRCELVYLDKWENNQKVHKNLLKNALDYDKILGNILLRPRQAADAYHPVGRGCGKTLKKLFQEAALPSFERACVPVLVDGGGIVLVTGFGCDRRVAPDEQTKRLLLFCKYEKTGETD